MKATDNFYGSEPTFDNRKLFAQLLSPYDIHYDFAAGYKDAVREIEESNKTVEDTKLYIDTFIEISKDIPIDDYEVGYRQAYKDYIKQEMKESATNE